MNYQIVFIIFCLINISNSQWEPKYQYLCYNSIYTQNNGPSASDFAGNFLLPNQLITAKFITCTKPSISYITLNSRYPSAQMAYKIEYENGFFLSVDFYFRGKWTSQTVTITIDSFSHSFIYNSPTNYLAKTGFCDDMDYDIKTINFIFSTSVVGKLQFTSSNTIDGQVSIRNLYIQGPKCYPSCLKCTGPKSNQCTKCYYGLPQNNICPPCPSHQFYMKRIGCRDICDISYPLYYNGFCQSYSIEGLDQFQWFQIYDPLNVDTSPKVISDYYGIFKFNSGVQKFYESLTTYSYAIHLIGLKITIFTFNAIPLNCGIKFLIMEVFKLNILLYRNQYIFRFNYQSNNFQTQKPHNNTYFGSIYRNESGIQTHNIKIYYNYEYGSFQNYQSHQMIQLITYVDVPKQPFLFSAIGNYSDNTAGWGLYKFEVTTGFCPSSCLLCEVSFKCKTCQVGSYKYNNNTCIYGCSQRYQKKNGTDCYDFDNETPFQTLQIWHTILNKYAEYILISQNGNNFLKGSNIYYSFLYWDYLRQRIFGGPLIWAQAKFERTHTVDDPHHSITIAFYILYGPAFPSDGQFIYQVENNSPVSKSTNNVIDSYSNGVKYDRVYERINHDTTTLTINWECFGLNNEPINAYCGFYNYYVAVHKCQPYCLKCQDQNTCTQWSSDYDANVVKFSQDQCLMNQYFDNDSYRCLDCPISCLTCTSKIDCQTCKSTYIQTKLGCICKLNQYEDSNQCQDCPIECNQCLNQTNCLECLSTNYRQLKNQQCICIDGYYPIQLNPKCERCHQFCKTCTGPTFNDCLTCNDIDNIENVGSTCRCPIGLFYQLTSKSCLQCHPSCQACFLETFDSCLTCDASLNRILKGLKCTCEPGYYELNNICTNCPNTEDALLSQCYKLCSNNQQIWHTNTCNFCDSGFHLISGECQPICGDLQIVGYEECEDNNTILDDLCYNCQFQCPVHCLTCDESTTLPCPDICGDGIITGMEECEDGNTIQYDGCFNCQYQCQLSCTKCIKGECFECNTGGFFVDPTVQPWRCQERCGDQLIVGQEQCEDGNQVDTDGCKDCKYFCRIGCSSCDYTTNTCLSCELPGFIPEKFYCKNICGDKFVVVDPYGYYQEECDDGNTDDDDGCNNNCKFQCQSPWICKSCSNNRCQECYPEYFLTENQLCISICGDSKIAIDEQCEDIFILPYKGCQNCKAKCQSSCITCDTTGKGCLACRNGYRRIDNLCYSICGDQIVTEDEECDDGNLIFEDGCNQCSFSCPITCSNCQKGVCHDCHEGYQYINHSCVKILKQEHDPRCNSFCLSCSIERQGCLTCQVGFVNINGICHPNCGDQLVVADEQCDDGNLIFEDGCNQCSYSCPITCSNCQKGVCHKCHEGYQYINHSCVKILKQEHDPRCNSFCLSCSIERQGCLTCQVGFVNINGICYPNCGDQLVVAGEQCDDGNLIFEDGCNQCYFNCPITCSKCHQGGCVNCPKTSLLYNQKCLEVTENFNQKEYNNFQFSQLTITQAFTTTPIQTSRIQMKIIEFVQQVYNQVGQYAEFMGSSFPFINIEINIQCIQNMQVKSHFIKHTYEKEVNNEEILFSYGCHQTFNQDITFSFKLEKIVLKDEILVIAISEDELKLSSLKEKYTQRLLYITFEDV
ncbi:unnamed protein product [Paramecium pentaurelia]|uniref:EGF-like domain-containing protein n=1 Tax=Paramecium pentaurelia TaxID=43138 RepID=A0A8S1WIR1_9CILI|nr:unnamed protein product [Paramecium pentaurelia]